MVDAGGAGVRPQAELGARVSTQVGAGVDRERGPGRLVPTGASCSGGSPRPAVQLSGQTLTGMRSRAGAAMALASTLWAWRMPRAPSTNITPEPMKAAIAAHIAMVPKVAKA